MAPHLVAPPELLFRCSRIIDGLVLTSWEYIRRGARGRWDDTEEEYRVLYASDSAVGALVEVLQDLRQEPNARSELDAIEGPDEAPITIHSVLVDRLRSRYLVTMIPTEPGQALADISHGETRSYVEQSLQIPTTKIGDFIGTDRSLSRRCSRLLYDASFNGVSAPSAEHGGSRTSAIFETHSVSGHVRLGLVVRNSDLALTFAEEIAAAAAYLGLDVVTTS